MHLPVFLLTEMSTSSRILSALAPLSLTVDRSTRTMWLSVPPVTTLYPRLDNSVAKVLALVTTLSW